MKHEYYLLIPNRDGSRLWLVEEQGRWVLPQLEIAEDFWWQDVAPLNRAAQARLGCGVTTICCLPITVDRAQEVVRFIYAVAPQGPLPETGLWVKEPALEPDNLPW